MKCDICHHPVNVPLSHITLENVLGVTLKADICGKCAQAFHDLRYKLEHAEDVEQTNIFKKSGILYSEMFHKEVARDILDREIRSLDKDYMLQVYQEAQALVGHWVEVTTRFGLRIYHCTGISLLETTDADTSLATLADAPRLRFTYDAQGGETSRDDTWHWYDLEKPRATSWFVDEIRSMRIINYDDAVRKYHYGGNVK